MFILVPSGHDQLTVRRWPVWTITFIVINVLSWAATLLVASDIEPRSQALLAKAATIVAQHPELPVSERLAYRLAADRRAAWQVRHPTPSAEAGENEGNAAEELASLEAQLEAVEAGDVRALAAFGRGQHQWWRALTSQFAHGGWLHLIFNCWYLWLAGVALEDRWGRAIFPAFYLLAGVVAGLLHMAASPVPAIGASGAVAALMGAFALQMPFAKIGLFFLGLLPIPVAVSGRYGRILPLLRFPPISLVWARFPVPAIGALLLWGAMEVLDAVFVERDGVAHWAHVGGFAFGLVVAALLRVSGFDRKLDQAVEDSGSLLQNPELLRAGTLVDQGRAGLAIVRLRKLLTDPKCDPLDVNLELLRAAESAGSARDALAAQSALIGLYLSRGGPALELYEQVQRAGQEGELPGELRVRVATELAKQGKKEAAAQALDRVVLDEGMTAGAVKALIARAQMALREGEMAIARQYFLQAAEGENLVPEASSQIAAGLRAAQKG